jgi:hypothetical protein
MTKSVKKSVQKSAAGKKITIKFFLNKALQPHIINKKKTYPLYMLITYDRRNTMLKCHYGHYYKDLKEVSTDSTLTRLGLLVFEENIIRKTIAYEMEKAGNKFSLKGLHKKYDQYSISIHLLFEQYLKGILQKACLSAKPQEFSLALNFSSHNVSFDTLYTIAEKIYPDLNKTLPRNFQEELVIFHDFQKLYGFPVFEYTFPTVIEWLDNSARAEYQKRLSVGFKNDKKMITRCIALVGNIVQSSMEG